MKFFFKIVILQLLFLVSLPGKAETVSDLLNEANVLQNTVSNGLDRANNILNEQQITFFSSLQFFSEYLIGQIRNQALGDLTSQLRSSELNLLHEIRLLNNTIATQGNLLQEQMENLALTLENTVARVPFAKRTPTPIFYTLPLITASQDEVITIKIRGVNLTSPKNHIIFKGKIIPRGTNPSDRENTFLVPLKKGDLFKFNDTSNVFTVVLYKRNKPYTYKKNFYVLPNQVATVTFFYDVPKSRTKRSSWYTTTKSATSGSSKTKNKSKMVNLKNSAAEGWLMDKSSISCRKKSGSGDKHEYRGPESITDISFVMGATAKDGKAVCECKWRERIVEKFSETETKVVHVTFSDQNHAGSLPSGSIYKYTEIKFSGDKEEKSFVDKTGVLGPIKFALSPNGANYTVQLER